MKVISIINLKGGVAKTVSAINIAHVLAEVHGQRVLLVDNDKQGNTSKFFDVHSDDLPSIAEILTKEGFPVLEAVRKTRYPRLDVLPANMGLLKANKEVLLDCTWPQQTRLAEALRMVEDGYDYMIIDNAPDLSMNVVNALVASDDVLIPVKADKFTFDGVKEILEHIEGLRRFNRGLRVVGGFLTMYQNNSVNARGAAAAQSYAGLPMLNTVIRKTVQVDKSTFTGLPLLVGAQNSTAAMDYEALVVEYLNCVSSGHNSERSARHGEVQH